MTWITSGLAVALAFAAVYAAFFAAVLMVMLQPPERFGRFMRHAPEPLVWRLLPASRMWLWARRGTLEVGRMAPDFTLSMADRTRRVTLSLDRGRPVVLVFGSYT